MTVRHYTHSELSPDQRARGAREARQKLHAFLGMPLAPEQVKQVHEKLAELAVWEQGKPLHHKVEISEGVSVSEKIT